MDDQILLLGEFRQILKAKNDSGNASRTDKYTKKLLLYVFAGTRGGLTRLRIIMRLLADARNTNQLANDLGLDYKAVKHHLRVLERNSMVKKIGDDRYGALYCISDLLEAHLAVLDMVIDKLSYNIEKKNRKKIYL